MLSVAPTFSLSLSLSVLAPLPSCHVGDPTSQNLCSSSVCAGRIILSAEWPHTAARCSSLYHQQLQQSYTVFKVETQHCWWSFNCVSFNATHNPHLLLGLERSGLTLSLSLSDTHNKWSVSFSPSHTHHSIIFAIFALVRIKVAED